MRITLAYQRFLKGKPPPETGKNTHFRQQLGAFHPAEKTRKSHFFHEDDPSPGEYDAPSQKLMMT